VTAIRAWLRRQPPGYRLTFGRILAIYSGLMTALLLASLDQTIVATALPRVVSDLGGLGLYSWAFTAYVLAMTVTVPLYGKLGDIYGSKPLFVFAISIFVLGSVLCGLAWSMPALIAFRAVQGIGAGGLFALTHATIGRIVPPRARGRWQGLIGVTFAIGSIAGPAIGGVIVDNASWRWIFFVNVPVGALALIVIALTMPRRAPRLHHSVDYRGAALLAGGIGALMLGLSWGGHQYAWDSPEVLGALALSALLLAAFGLLERQVREPILPFELLRRRTVAAGIAATGLAGMAMFGVIAFVPLFVQGVIGSSATSSGAVLTPFMLAVVVTSILSGQWISWKGRYRPNAIAGPIVLGTGLMFLGTMDASTTTGRVALYMVISGIGLGLMMQTFVVAVQNSVPIDSMGSATALTQFSRSIGTTLGVTLMGVIVNQGLPSGVRLEGESVQQLSPALRNQLADALHPAFFAAAFVCAILFVVVAVGIREVPLRRGLEESAPEAAGAVGPEQVAAATKL
jgi:EmrB/QacA subfamily drug resistance transporter